MRIRKQRTARWKVWNERTVCHGVHRSSIPFWKVCVEFSSIHKHCRSTDIMSMQLILTKTKKVEIKHCQSSTVVRSRKNEHRTQRWTLDVLYAMACTLTVFQFEIFPLNLEAPRNALEYIMAKCSWCWPKEEKKNQKLSERFNGGKNKIRFQKN